MKQLLPFLKILRPVNLLIIILTQYLFWFYIVVPDYAIFSLIPLMSVWQVLLLMLSTVLIAGGGYVINDYYDLPIDLVNKPDKVIVSRTISDNVAFNYYIGLTIAGIASALIVALTLGNYALVILPITIACLLWFYAQTFKRMFLVGNIIVAFSSAAVIFLLLLFEVDWAKNAIDMAPETNDILKFGLGYMIFAFLMSMVREVVKDLQDKEGDEQFECRTLPVVWGITGGKIVAALFMILVMAGVCRIQLVLLDFKNYLPFAYLLIMIQLPAIYMLVMLFKAKNAGQFSTLSKGVKAIMLFGVLTMIYVGIMFGKHG
ncbi:MAG: UbiA family prenyltransferase [Bacteroidetes bacterium]|nr:UbiA family prenyltransferase [Bacteroidota bacterium]